MSDIYPKQILRDQNEPVVNECFVLMPFSSEFDEIYAEIKTSLKRVGFTCARADDLFDNRPIMTNVVRQIVSSHFVIADLTNRNPNVFYEVGIAHSARDIPNVLLISQDMDFVPFDLRHLPILVYEKDNLRGLTTRLIKKILENKDLFASVVELRRRYLRYFQNERTFDLAASALQEMPQVVGNAIHALLGIRKEIQEADLVTGVMQFNGALQLFSGTDKHDLLVQTYPIFRDLLVFGSRSRDVLQYVTSTLESGKLAGWSLTPEENTKLVADLAIAAFLNPLVKRYSIQWLLAYIAKRKVGGVDLNRYKIEAFIISNPDPDLYSAIVDSLYASIEDLRENCADILGELRNADAVPALIRCLDRENNPYCVRSVISALGKIANPLAGGDIVKWVTENIDKISATGHLFILDYAREALARIDERNGTMFSKQLVIKT